MVDAPEYGLMLWDLVVYLAPKKTFRNIRSTDDVFELLATCDRASVQRLERELGIDELSHRLPSL
jgi:hypothetical protein